MKQSKWRREKPEAEIPAPRVGSAEVGVSLKEKMTVPCNEKGRHLRGVGGWGCQGTVHILAVLSSMSFPFILVFDCLLRVLKEECFKGLFYLESSMGA